MNMDDEFQKFRAEINAWARGRERKFLEDWCRDARVTEPVAYEYEYGKGFVIYTNRPGYLIGKAGNLIAKYEERLQKEFGQNNKIKIVEVRGGFANYQSVKEMEVHI